MVNVTEPMQPMVVGHVTPLSNAVRVAVKKDWVFVAENTAESDGSKLIAIDAAIKEMPEMITTRCRRTCRTSRTRAASSSSPWWADCQARIECSSSWTSRL